MATPDNAGKLSRHWCILADGVKLALFLKIHPKPLLPGLVVLLHGRLHSSQKGPCHELSKRLPFSCLTYDARGMGQSEGCTRWANVEEEVSDLEQVIEKLKSGLPLACPWVLAIVGHSKGAAVCLKYGAGSTFKNQIAQPNLHDQKSRPPLLVSISARYDGSQTGLSRFTPSQCDQLEKEGQFVWLRYRAGLNNQQRRQFVVTKDDTELARCMTLECVSHIAEGSQVLLLHGRADGTVSFREAEKIDHCIRDHSERTSVDLILVEGAQHNWDGDGEIEMMAAYIKLWILRRAGRDSARIPEHLLRDHLRLETLDRST